MPDTDRPQPDMKSNADKMTFVDNSRRIIIT
jgi:hypothetical protein